MTDSNELTRAIALFNEALAQPSAERDTWLRTQCQGETSLLLRVQQMLAADALTRADFGTGGALPPELLAEFAPPPTAIGHYKLAKLLGEGGMGSVYLANRSDGVLQQQVAIKLMKRNLTSTNLIQQFSRERQIMANLRHPSIASLFDGGTTDDGLPYLVMEYIDGLLLTDYIAKHQPSLQQRLNLFQALLSAVAHAHQNLIIHRDIKPSNVMVTATGEPKLMDFGVARLLDPTSTGSRDEPGQANDSTTPRETVAMLMTLSYASPEQIRGEPLTTSTDIYSLGLLLFECLTGEPMVDVAGLSPLDAEKRINATSERLPSDHLKIKNSLLAGQLIGDLDAIIRKASAIDSKDRYPTVAAFDADLKAFMAGDPVTAQRNTWRYRSRKFVRRHWLGVSTAAMASLTIVGASLYSVQQTNIAREQRAIAQQESATARDAVAFLKNMLFSVNPLTGEANAETVDDILLAMNRELATSFIDRPATRVLLLASAAEVYLSRGDLDQAAALAQQAQALTKQTNDLAPNARAFSMRVIAQVHLELGDYQQAAIEFEDSLKLYDVSQEKHWAEISSNYSDLGAALMGLGKEVEAEKSIRRSIEIHRTPNLNDPEAYGTSLSNLAGLHMDRGNYEEAKALQEQAIDAFQSYSSSPGRISMLQSNYAGTLWRLGHVDEAEQQYLEAIETLENTLGPEHPEALIAKTSLGSLYLELKQYNKGATLMATTAEIADRTLDPGHIANSYAKNIAGQLLCETDDVASGSAFLSQSLSARIDSFGAKHWVVASARSSLGNCLAKSGEIQQAVEMLSTAHVDLQQLRGADHHLTLLAAKRLMNAQQLLAKDKNTR